MVEKKKWFEVEIPSVGQKIKLFAFNIGELDGRFVKLDLTRILRGKSIEAVVKIKVDKERAVGDIIKMSLLGFYIRRMMRTNVSYVEDSFSTDANDSILRIKPFMITRKKVTRAVRNALRIAAKKYIEDFVKERDSEKIFSDIVGGRLGKELSLKLKKIYPLALCEIREIHIEKFKEGVIVEKIKEAAAEKPQREKTQIEEIEEEQARKQKENEEKKDEIKEEKKEVKEEKKEVKEEKKEVKEEKKEVKEEKKE
jgi:ribosomal protein S3AE